jgi:shikimate kinase
MIKSIVLIGMAGCGKTTIGREAAARLGRPFIDVDDAIVDRFGPIPELFEKGEPYFRQCESLAVEEACKVEGAVIATGGGVVTQPGNMEALRRVGIVAFIDRPIDRIVRDIDVSTRPLYVCGVEALHKTYVNRLPLYRGYADFIVDNSGNMEDTVRKIIEIAGEGEA